MDTRSSPSRPFFPSRRETQRPIVRPLVRWSALIALISVALAPRVTLAAAQAEVLLGTVVVDKISLTEQGSYSFDVFPLELGAVVGDVQTVVLKNFSMPDTSGAAGEFFIFRFLPAEVSTRDITFSRNLVTGQWLSETFDVRMTFVSPTESISADFTLYLTTDEDNDPEPLPFFCDLNVLQFFANGRPESGGEIQLAAGACPTSTNNPVLESYGLQIEISFELTLTGDSECDDGIDNDGDGDTDLADIGCANSGDLSEQSPHFPCDDGIDNDGDQAIDFPSDPGCSEPGDTSEAFACNDRFDNDEDGTVDFGVGPFNDPGCSSIDDDDERNALVECDDGIDNDQDGSIDNLDPGCASPSDTSERNFEIACDDGLDNDKDGFTDFDDPGCLNSADPTEWSPQLVCDNGLDDDGDFLVDYKLTALEPNHDFGCDSPTDPSERGPAFVCDNGIDDDGDGIPDFPQDTGCSSALDSDELGNVACDNGLDDDGDGQIDINDPGCASIADTSELNSAAQCDDGLDNDGDGDVDLDDPGCEDSADVSELDPAVECDDGVDNDDDGKIDYDPGQFLGDPDCDSPLDTMELPEPKALLLQLAALSALLLQRRRSSRSL